MSLLWWLILIVYLAVALTVLFGAVWLDTLDNPYSKWTDWQIWVQGATAGILWPVLAIFIVWNMAKRR